MEVKFNLTSVQVAKMKDLRKKNQEEKKEWEDNDWSHFIHNAGVFHVFHGGACFNDDQSLSFERNILAYKGQRHPLWQDGLGELLAEIAGYDSQRQGHKDGWSRLEVVEYSTTDTRLAWWETLSSWLEDQPWEAWANAYLAHGRCGVLSPGMIWSAHPEVWRWIIMIHRDQSKIHAEVQRGDLQLLRKVHARLSMYYDLEQYERFRIEHLKLTA